MPNDRPAGSSDRAAHAPSNQDAPRIALVAATYRRPDALRTLFRSLHAQSLPPTCFEVSIVVDGLDESEGAYRELFAEESERARFPLQVEFQENAGPAAARNRAARSVRAPWICIVDDDMDLSRDFLASHLKLLEANGERAVVIGKVVPEEGWERQPLYEAMRTKAMLRMHREIEDGREPNPAAFVTQNVSLSRALFFEVGCLDEELPLAEDTELGFRLLHAGAKFVFGSDASAIHRSRIGSYESWLSRQVRYGALSMKLYEKAGRDPAAHPLRNLVTGNRLKFLAVHAACWWDPLAHFSMAMLRLFGLVLHRMGLVAPAIGTHNAIMALAYHLGVKQTLGSWSALMEAERSYVVLPGRPLHRS